MEERRKGDRRKLYGKPFLAMLIGGLPEDRRKGERRGTSVPVEAAAQTLDTVRGEFSAAEGAEVQR
jgi:hypothetical protein